MKHLFYFCTIIPLIYEFLLLKDPNMFLTLGDEMKSLGKKIEKADPGDIKVRNESLRMVINVFGMLFAAIFYLIWVIIGLFTFQWYLFAVLLLIGFVNSKITKKIKDKRLVTRVNATICMIILIFIYINAYYL